MMLVVLHRDKKYIDSSYHFYTEMIPVNMGICTTYQVHLEMLNDNVVF